MWKWRLKKEKHKVVCKIFEPKHKKIKKNKK
jgi:hypothetical protein